MAFSIPPQISPNYIVPVAGFVGDTLSIGTAVKDMPDGGDTPMKIEYNAAVKRANEKYRNDQTQYDKDFKRLTDTAGIATGAIGEARKMKMYAITALVATIITAVGIAIASAATGTLPFAFAAIPFLIGIAPASYYTHIYRTRVLQLEADIKAPKILPKPELHLPTYNPSQDLDLRQTRIDIQNMLAHKTLAQLADARYAERDIVNYALLDKVTAIAAAKRPAFYGKCIQLIQAHGKLCQEQQRCTDVTEASYRTLTNDLTRWKTEQDRNIRSAEWNLQNQEQAATRTECRMSEQKPYRPVVVAIHAVSNAVTRMNLENQKREVERNFGAREADLRNWRLNTNQAINAGFTAAINQLEHQYTLAKTAAA